MTGSFRRHIAWRAAEKSKLNGDTYQWYVKPPDYRLTHLLVHGHTTVDSGRTKEWYCH